ncbi:ABC transporter permease [Consotaella aegiceratis]|uniref:ABC transporter permease n=1 Tax=Consotaella aegiceratis TaxID=3097961 RepID=UPI002F403370
MTSAVLMMIARRLANSLFVLFALSIMIFLFVRAMPGDPVAQMLGDEMVTQDQYDELQAELGLDLSLPAQYLRWAGNALHGDLGRSLQSQDPVLPTVRTKLKATAELALVAVLIGTAAGLFLGFCAAVWRGSWIDGGSMLLSLAGVSMPVFWVGIILIELLAVEFDFFPTGGMADYSTIIQAVTGFTLIDAILTGNWSGLADVLHHIVLPAVTLATAPAALIARTTRASVLEVINEDYVRAGLARGLGFGGVLLRHVLRNAMIPVITVIGLEIGVYLGGSIVTEKLFSWPGLGSYMMNAIYSNDYAAVQGAVIVYAIIVVLVNLIVDVSYGLIDPRVRN